MNRKSLMPLIWSICLVMAIGLFSCKKEKNTLQGKAERGDPDAQFALATVYAKGEGVKQDYNESAKWLLKAAERGHPDARFQLGVAYYNGIGVRQNRAEAAKWYRLAAEQGHAGAQNNLGAMYATAQGVSRDYAEAAKWYLKAAEQGNLHAQVNVASAYSSGRGLPRDDRQAYIWYSIAAERSSGASRERLDKARNEIGKRLSARDRVEALKAIIDWNKKHPPGNGGPSRSGN